MALGRTLRTAFRQTLSALPTITSQATRIMTISVQPPQDTGKRAWLFLFGACIIEIAAWGMYRVDRSTYQADLWAGFPYCYGVFESYFLSNPPFEGMTIVSVGGVLCNVRGSLCLLYRLMSLRVCYRISLPPIIYYVNNFPKQRKLIMWSGCLLCTGSAVGAGFSKTVCSG